MVEACVPSRVRSATTRALLAAQVVASLGLAGVIWTVQLAVYPQLALVGERHFAAWHASYTGGIALVVGPLMALETVAAAALLWLPPPRVPRAVLRMGLVLVAVALASTALVQAPLHGRLAGGFDPDLHGLLVASNWLRTAVWSLRGALAAWMATRGTEAPPRSGSGETPKERVPEEPAAASGAAPAGSTEAP